MSLSHQGILGILTFAIVGVGTLSEARSESPLAETSLEKSTVEFKGGAGRIKGYFARPKGDGPFPAIVVVHEWWGLSDWVKQNTDRLAAEGYAVLAVDLYDGKVTDDKDVAHELSRLDQNDAVADLKGGVAFLKGKSFVDKSKKMGVIGWCMGGMFARLLAQESDAIGPVAICYGMVSLEPAQVDKLKGKPVLGIFAEKDHIPADKVKQFAKAVEERGSKVDLKIYEGAGHGFMRPGGESYHEKSAKDAWERISAFFAANLKKA